MMKKMYVHNKVHLSILAELVRRLRKDSDYLLRASNVLYTLSGRFDAVEDYKGNPSLPSASTAGVQSLCVTYECR